MRMIITELYVCMVISVVRCSRKGKRRVAQGASFLSVIYFFFSQNDLKQIGQRVRISMGLNNRI